MDLVPARGCKGRERAAAASAIAAERGAMAMELGHSEEIEFHSLEFRSLHLEFQTGAEVGVDRDSSESIPR